MSQAIPAGGGTASVTLGKQTASVTVPAGAFASAVTLRLTLSATTALPVAFASIGRRAAQSVPTGATPLVALTIDSGGAPLLVPLQIAFSGAAAPVAGTTALVTGFNNSAFCDVATTTYDGTNYTTAVNAHYPGLTLAAATLYVLYAVPTANIAAPASVVTVAGPATVSTAVAGTYTASEATPNRFPFLGHSFTYSIDNATLGTINSTTGVLTGGGLGALGNVTATDAAVSTFSGKLAVAVTSARPGTSGLTEQYTGTLTEVDANNVINLPSPAPISITTTAQATVNVSTAAATDGSGNVLFTANESDASNLTTLTAATVSTVAYQTLNASSVNVRALKTVATESTGAIYEHDYASTNGLLTVLPETPSTFSNDAAEEYKETDPGVGISTAGGQQVTTDRIVGSSGTYTANILEPNVNTGAPVTDRATEASDFSGSLALNSIDSTFSITFAKPANGLISVAFVDPSQSLNNPGSTPTWIPSSLTQPSVETDTISAATALDPSCSPTVGTAGPWMLTTQQIAIADVVNGTLETRTTKTYDAPAIGTVCTVVADTIKTFYDYSGQQGGFLIFFANSATQPVLTTTISETLSLHTSNAATVTGKTRTPQSIAGGTFALLPPSMVASRIQYLARKRSAAQSAAFRTSSTQLLRGGLAK